MGVMNMRLWRKAYMFEFLDTKTEKNEYFSFAVPPESEDFDFPQRIIETKTMGGSVFDDYGNDTFPIQLNGTTINEEKKLIYRGKDGKFIPKYLSGEKEIFELQKLINDWGKGNKIPGKKIYLYDLSKMSGFQLLGAKGLEDGYFASPVRNYWRVIIKKLKIKRSKEKPNTYVYSLEMVGMEDNERGGLQPLLGGETLNSVLSGIQKTVEVIQGIVALTELAADAVDETMDAANGMLDTFEALASGDPQKITGALDSPVRSLIGVSPRDLYNKGKSLIATGQGLVDRIKNMGTDTAKSASQWRDDIFAVTFNSNGGSYVPPQKVAYSQKATRPVNPVKEKNGFENWYTDEALTKVYDFDTEISGNLTLYAKWTQLVATLTFNSRGGSAVEPQNVTIGETAIIPDPPPTRNGFLLEAWCTDIEAQQTFNFDTPIVGDTILYAHWKIVCKVTFRSNGGSAVADQIVEVGGKVIYPTIPTLENYHFGIWCTDEELTTEYDFNSPVTDSLILYAKWAQVSNTVTYQSNGGSAVPSETVPMGGNATQPPNPAREGYAFVRWCSDPALTDEFIFATMPINFPTTVYAKWQIDIKTVAFNSNGGTYISNKEVEYGDLIVYPPTPEKDDFLFDRWCTDEELTTEYDFSIPVTENFTLYAKWFGGV